MLQRVIHEASLGAVTTSMICYPPAVFFRELITSRPVGVLRACLQAAPLPDPPVDVQQKFEMFFTFPLKRAHESSETDDSPQTPLSAATTHVTRTYFYLRISRYETSAMLHNTHHARGNFCRLTRNLPRLEPPLLALGVLSAIPAMATTALWARSQVF